jgi:hypothetical protein
MNLRSVMAKLPVEDEAYQRASVVHHSKNLRPMAEMGHKYTETRPSDVPLTPKADITGATSMSVKVLRKEETFASWYENPMDLPGRAPLCRAARRRNFFNVIVWSGQAGLLR